MSEKTTIETRKDDEWQLCKKNNLNDTFCIGKEKEKEIEPGLPDVTHFSSFKKIP
jgi:hypothetical protein